MSFNAQDTHGQFVQDSTAISSLHGLAYMPLPCGAGQFARDYWDKCEDCAWGTYDPRDNGNFRDETGDGCYSEFDDACVELRLCEPCGLGTYQDKTGASECVECPWNSDYEVGGQRWSTTLMTGQVALEACVCKVRPPRPGARGGAITPCSVYRVGALTLMSQTRAAQFLS